MTSPFVSVCVPFYNVAPYIERCVRSIMEQTYPNLEYVFVNDGSTDESVSILESVLGDYPERRKNVRIITNNRNRGTAYSRRVYTENATGEYITCVDSDDYVEPNMVECMVNKAIETNADIVVAGYYYETNTIDIIEPYPCNNETDYIFLVLSDLLNSMWSRLFRRTLFTEGRSCYAPEGLDCGEDRLMFFFIASKAKKIVTINKPLYHYIQRSDSISQNKNEKNFYYSVRFWAEVENRLAEMDLTRKYRQLVGTKKIADKAQLLMYCNNQTRKHFVDLYAEEEQRYTPQLPRGVALMHWLTKHHLWLLTYCYQCYIRWLMLKKWKQIDKRRGNIPHKKKD